MNFFQVTLIFYFYRKNSPFHVNIPRSLKQVTIYLKSWTSRPQGKLNITKTGGKFRVFQRKHRKSDPFRILLIRAYHFHLFTHSDTRKILYDSKSCLQKFLETVLKFVPGEKKLKKFFCQKSAFEFQAIMGWFQMSLCCVFFSQWIFFYRKLRLVWTFFGA